MKHNSKHILIKTNLNLLTTLRLFGLCAGIFFMSLQGRAQTSARHPSYPLLSPGLTGMKEYVLNKSNVYSKADSHSLNVSEKHYTSIDELALSLCPSDWSESEKVRSIYFWIANNIHYDHKALETNRFSSQVADSVFLNRKAVCEGFSSLFVEICRHAGLQARTLDGYVKDEFFDQTKILVYPNHAWNAVKINDKWHLLDVTWACLNNSASNSREKTVDYFRYKLESNFLVAPEQFIHTHLPEDPYWQLLPVPVASEDFFEGNFFIEPSIQVDVHQRIDELDRMDSLDREIAFCERMVPNQWNRFKEYRLGIAYYYKAQQLYRKSGQLQGRQRNRMLASINTYYDKSLAELRKLNTMDFGYEYCKDIIQNIETRKELITPEH